jgi:hypothetical protein
MTRGVTLPRPSAGCDHTPCPVGWSQAPCSPPKRVVLKRIAVLSPSSSLLRLPALRNWHCVTSTGCCAHGILKCPGGLDLLTCFVAWIPFHPTAEFLKRIEPVMRAPLPRVWDAVEGGLAEPTRATISHGHQHTVGGDVSIAGLEEARRYARVLNT